LNTIGTKSGDVTRGRARAAVSSLFVWLMQEGMTETNPVIGTKGQSERRQGERVLSDDELGKVWTACCDDDFGRSVKLLVLTGCRRQEIAGLSWSEIHDGAINLPVERSKNHRAHVIPLTPMMKEVLSSVHHMVGRDHLFGRSDTGFGGFRNGEQKLR